MLAPVNCIIIGSYLSNCLLPTGTKPSPNHLWLIVNQPLWMMIMIMMVMMMVMIMMIDDDDDYDDNDWYMSSSTFVLRPQCLKNLISPILLSFYSEVPKLCHCNQKHNDKFVVRVISLSLSMPWHMERFKWYGVNSIPAWISNYVHYKVKLIYSFPNFNATVKVLEWVSNFIPHFVMNVIIYPCWN